VVEAGLSPAGRRSRAPAVVVTMPANDPSYGTLKRYASAAAEVVNVWVNVVADEAPAASADTTPL
jgi:hypothetical protein